MLNFIFIIALFIPATEQVKIYKFIFDNSDTINKIYYYDDNPYIIDDLEPRFYTSYLPKIKKYNKKENYKDYYLIIRDYNFYIETINKKNCSSVFSIYPKIVNLNKNWRQRKFNWYIVYCN